jgi:hypothetical protein
MASESPWSISGVKENHYNLSDEDQGMHLSFHHGCSVDPGKSVQDHWVLLMHSSSPLLECLGETRGIQWHAAGAWVRWCNGSTGGGHSYGISKEGVILNQPSLKRLAEFLKRRVSASKSDIPLDMPNACLGCQQDYLCRACASWWYI